MVGANPGVPGSARTVRLSPRSGWEARHRQGGHSFGTYWHSWDTKPHCKGPEARGGWHPGRPLAARGCVLA